MDYVYAIVDYKDSLGEVTHVIYIAPEKYWSEVEDLENYREVDPGSLEKFLMLRLGSGYRSYDAVHWTETSGKSKSEIGDDLESAGMSYSETLEEYGNNDVLDFGDVNISELFD